MNKVGFYVNKYVREFMNIYEEIPVNVYLSENTMSDYFFYEDKWVSEFLERHGINLVELDNDVISDSEIYIESSNYSSEYEIF